jgi:hypothetical protein
MNKERRLALLLADGTGNYDFVRAVVFEDTVILEGHVHAYKHKRRAEELARYVGFSSVLNTLRIHPSGDEVEASDEDT